ncbi:MULTISPECIES: DUF1289 domain-containing protein [unclassified Bradyrhizobium]|uniref:DUF1289 domain-containing protein n=1 Tax=unclassified Bradyrhizobium TaxID=2631580 RepID=UPI002013435C|nr:MULTISPECIES: DUF1289 domain-containing protein [unclassified Bradyrhizobium]
MWLNSRMSVDTPCIKVCVIDPLSGLCRGCGRTLAEIGAWSALSPDARRTVMAALPARLAAAGLPAPHGDFASS